MTIYNTTATADRIINSLSQTLPDITCAVSREIKVGWLVE